jgi:hypothetical protein
VMLVRVKQMCVLWRVPGIPMYCRNNGLIICQKDTLHIVTVTAPMPNSDRQWLHICHGGWITSDNAEEVL